MLISTSDWGLSRGYLFKSCLDFIKILAWRKGERAREKQRERVRKREIERDRQIMYNIYFINITF